MKIDLPEYIEDPIRQKLHKVMQTVMQIIPEKPDEFFVSTALREASLDYVGIWLFTPRLVVEIRNPLGKDRIQYEMARFKGAVDWIRLNARNYDLKAHQADSALDLEFTTEDAFSSVLSANGAGCDELMKVYREVFIANFTALSK